MKRRRGARLFLLLPLALALPALAGGCSQPGRGGEGMPQVDLWPLLYYQRDRDTGARELELLWPLCSWSDDAAQSLLCLRPLWSRRTDKRSGESQWVFLYPNVAAGTSRAGDHESRALFLYKHVSADAPGGRHRELDLLPFFVFGSRDGARALVIFPLFGSMTNWLGRDRWLLVCWPLFSYERIGQARKYNILFPLCAWRTGPGEGEGGFKLWPLFGYRRDPRGQAYFVLWPLFVRERARLPQAGPGAERVSFLSWPLWYQEDSPGGRYRAVLWPFFRYIYEVRDHRRRLEAPSPLFVWEKSDDGRVLRLLPLFIYRRSKLATDLSVLWPIIWWHAEPRQQATEELIGNLRPDPKHRRTTSLRILPILWIARDPRAEGDWSVFQLWPLVKHIREPDGSSFTEFPTLTWSARNEYFERNFAPFLRLIEYRRSADGEKDLRLLWRLMRWRARRTGGQGGGGRAFFELTPLVAWLDDAAGRQGAERFRLTILKGFFDWRKEGGRREVRLLYFIPIWRSGQAEAPEGARG